MTKNITLLISCPDKKGIVYAISKFVFENNGNIIDSQQYSLGLNAHFFMRLFIDGANFKIPQENLPEEFAKLAKQYAMDFSFHCRKKRMAILVSKYDHCLYDILLRHKYGELDVDIPIIISNHSDLNVVADKFNIPFEHIPVQEYDDISDGSSDNLSAGQKDKQKQEKKIITKLKASNIDFIALARYMQILSDNFINEYPYKIINVHHGFLPAFKGAKPYHQAYEKGVKIIGATSHYATHDLDMGPIITQGVIEVGHRDTVNDYIAKGRDIEKMVFSKAIKAHIEDKVIVYEGRTIVFD